MKHLIILGMALASLTARAARPLTAPEAAEQRAENAMLKAQRAAEAQSALEKRLEIAAGRASAGAEPFTWGKQSRHRDTISEKAMVTATDLHRKERTDYQVGLVD